MTPDENWMAHALALAQRARGLCSPNPMVGAVVVKDGRCVGEGWHHRAGSPHAEPNALDAAGERARGAELYVTLEPCSTTGRTPPCTRRILQAGIRRVVYGATDANPRHAGAAAGILAAAGVEVTGGVLEEECTRLNADFFWWITRKRPYVVLKMAMTMDGKIATADGDSQWISGVAAREYVQMLRKSAGAVMVGGATVARDNPSLLIRDPSYSRQPRRLVWTSRQIPPSSQMLSDGGPLPEIAKPQTASEWAAFLDRLGKEGVLNLLLEGGGELAASALRCGAVNSLQFFVAPKILGGRGSRPVVGGDDPVKLCEALAVRNLKVQPVGEDFLFSGEMPGMTAMSTTEEA